VSDLVIRGAHSVCVLFVYNLLPSPASFSFSFPLFFLICQKVGPFLPRVLGLGRSRNPGSSMMTHLEESSWRVDHFESPRVVRPSIFDVFRFGEHPFFFTELAAS